MYKIQKYKLNSTSGAIIYGQLVFSDFIITTNFNGTSPDETTTNAALEHRECNTSNVEESFPT